MRYCPNMVITYATSHRWHKPAGQNPWAGFGQNAQAKLRSSLSNLPSTVSSRIEPIGEDFLAKFIPLYEEQIGRKDHPRVFDIRDKTLVNKKIASPYFSLTIEDSGEFVGGLIFSVRESCLAIAYRSLKTKWPIAKLPAGPALYAEYLIAEQAVKEHKPIISHGKDRNPYGQNSSIGLAAFKLSVGCKALKSLNFETKKLDPADIHEDILVLEYPGDDKSEIERGYLIVSRATGGKWTQVTKYPDQLKVETIYRD